MQRRGPPTWLALAGWIGLAAITGVGGGIASLNAREFYAALVRPAWAPPGWVFGPVWSVLYVLMGVAAWLVWRRQPENARATAARTRGLTLFVVQLGLNALWTWLFFAWRQGAAAFVEILLLWIMIALTMTAFSRISRAAVWCLVPYLAWVSFAAALTWAVWRANPGQL